MFSFEYKFILNKYLGGNDTFYKSKRINTFLMVLDIFNSVRNIYDFTHFRRNFPPEWIYIPAIKLKDKRLWLDIWKYIFIYHRKYDPNFNRKFDKRKFVDLILRYYYKILNEWWLDYEYWNDLTVTFNKGDLKYVIKNYCNRHRIENFNKNVVIHPIEQFWCINKILFYRATKENWYCTKIIDSYEEWKNTKRVCIDFLNYFYKV